MQEQDLKNLFYIAHRKINKTTVFEVSKNFMPRVRFHKIMQKYFKFIILSVVFE